VVATHKTPKKYIRISISSTFLWFKFGSNDFEMQSMEGRKIVRKLLQKGLNCLPMNGQMNKQVVCTYITCTGVYMLVYTNRCIPVYIGVCMCGYIYEATHVWRP